MVPVIDVRDLTHHFGSFVAVDHIKLRVEPGEIFGFLGANGSGKTTSIRMLCGLLPVTAGVGTVNGLDILRHAEGIKRTIGYMAQRFSLYAELSVLENLKFYGAVYDLYGQAWERARDRVVEQTHLSEYLQSTPKDLPGGIRQRLALAAAIQHRPPLVFLDEPTGGVDPLERRNFWDLIRGLADEGMAVFVTTHFLDEAEHCHRIGLIADGRIIAEGAPEQLKRDHYQDDLVELVPNDPEGAIAILGNMEHILRIEPFGRRVHIEVASWAQARESVLTALTDRRITLEADRVIEPTLEDLFLKLVDRSREDAA